MTRINKPNVLTRAYQKGMIHHPNLAKIWLYQISDLIYKQYPPFSVKIFSDILSADIICSKKRTVSKSKTWGTLKFEEQIMTKDKFLCIFLRRKETIVFIILQIFFATLTVLAGAYSVTRHIWSNCKWAEIFDKAQYQDSTQGLWLASRYGNSMNDTIKLWTL